MKIKILFLVFIFTSTHLYSLDTTKNKIDKNFYKFLAVEGAVLTGAMSYLKNEWYSDKKRVPFHFYNDLKGWNQIDKFGHFYASYLESNVGYSLMKKFNFSERQSLYMGGFQGLILETPIEFFDAYYEGWGFSISDMVANALGSLFLFISRSYLVNKLSSQNYLLAGLFMLEMQTVCLVRITYSLSLFMITTDIPTGFPSLRRGYSI